MPTKAKLELLTFGCIRNHIEHNIQNKRIPRAIKEMIASFLPNLWIDSKILRSEEIDALLQVVNSHRMTEEFALCEWKLLLRASRDGYSTDTFHELCDHKKHTVCFVLTEFDHVCGGYVETEWKNGRDNNWAIKCDNAYMFVLRPTQEIFEQTKGSSSAVAHYWGDSFNFGYNDLYLKDKKQG
eukprot:387873_1